MQQQTILTCPVQLFRVRPETNELVDRGHCVCALVGLPAQPPKYSLVCYNQQQELLCVARLTTSNDSSVQFRVDPARPRYASFRDDLLDTWTVLFTKPELLVRLLAEMGVAFYVLSGRPKDRPLCALRAFTDVSEEGLTVGIHEALAHYTAFAIAAPAHQRETSAASVAWLPTCERVIETTMSLADLLTATGEAGTTSRFSDGDAEAETDEGASDPTRTRGPCRFFPVASMHSLPAAYRGFESSLNGMGEGAYGVVIVPAACRASSSPGPDAKPLTPLSASDVVFVVRLVQVRHRDVRAAVNGGRSPGADIPPAVFAETEERALVPATRTADLGRAAPTSAAVVPYTTSSGATLKDDSSDCFALVAHNQLVPEAGAAVGGSGVPLAHMTLIQKIGAGVQTAIMTTRDLRDIASQAEETWTYSVNRPKPSALSNAALVEQVQALVQASDARASEMARYDDLVRTLERKNNETQRLIEELTRRCDAALKNRSAVESAAVDANLDRRRLLLRVKEELSRSTQEREDTRRHLDSARKLLQTSTEVLRMERGKLDIQRVQQQSLDGRLAAALEASSVERSRRQTLESKSEDTQSEVRRAQAELRLLADRLHTLESKADGERDRYAALMEDERHRISADVLELRQNAVAELQRQEAQHRAACAEVQQKHYQRGYLEGREVGREASTMDLSVHRKELMLEVQRSSEALVARKEALQHVLEASLAARRANEANIHDVKHQLTEALERRAQLEMQWTRLSAAEPDGTGRTPFATRDADLTTSAAAGRVREAIVARLQAMLTNVVVPVPPSLLCHLIELAQRGEDTLPLTTVNQIRDTEETYVRDSLLRRAAWVEEELFSIYEKGEAVYYQQWLSALQPAHAAVRVTMQTLLGQQRGGLAVALYEIWLMETDARYTIEAQYDAFMSALATHKEEQAAQRAKVLRDATTALRATLHGFERGVRGIRLLWEYQIRAQMQLALEEAESRQTLEHEAKLAGRALPQMFADLQLGRHVAEQRVVLESEEAARAALITDECAMFSSLSFRMSTDAEDVVRAARARERSGACGAEEARVRAHILHEESLARGALQEGWREAQGLPTAPLEAPPLPPPPSSAALTAESMSPPTSTERTAAPVFPPPPQAAATAAAATARVTTSSTTTPTPGPAPTSVPSAHASPPPPTPTPPQAPPAARAIVDDDDAFERYWLAPPPAVASHVPPPLPSDDDDSHVLPTHNNTQPTPVPQASTPQTRAPLPAHVPASPVVPSSAEESSSITPPRPTAASSQPSPVAGLAMAEQQWRSQRPRHVLDDVGAGDAPTPCAPLATTEPLPLPPPQEPRVSPAVPAAEKEAHASPAPVRSPPARRASTSDSSSTITDDASGEGDDMSSSQVPTPERVPAPPTTHTVCPAAVPSATPPAVSAARAGGLVDTKPMAASHEASREASKAAIAAQAAAARAEKMKLFESSDSEDG